MFGLRSIFSLGGGILRSTPAASLIPRTPVLLTSVAHKSTKTAKAGAPKNKSWKLKSFLKSKQRRLRRDKTNGPWK